MESQVKEALEKIFSKAKGKSLFVEKPGITAIEFSHENFFPLKPAHHQIFFIDGGQAILLETPQVLVGIIRTAAVEGTMQGTKLVQREQDYVIINTVVKDNKLTYECTIFGKNSESVSINPNDSSIRDGQSRAPLAKALEVIRRKKELALAKKFATKGIVVLDGELDAKNDVESELLNELLKECKMIAGVVKGTSLVTDEGAPLIAVLGEIAPQGPWFYWPIIKSESIDWIIAKLCSDSRHIFRIDVPLHCDRKQIIACLAACSRDLSFPGYPYGLVVADQHARVSTYDASMLRASLVAGLAKEQAENPHSVLDKIVHKISRKDY